VTPAETRPTISPEESVTGVTDRIDGPREPTYVSVNVSPSKARSILPLNGLPIRSTVVCVNRVRSGAMTTMKSTPVT
jgi:hypothetical protein